MKYPKSTTFGCKEIGTRNSEFVAKTQFLFIQKDRKEDKRFEKSKFIPLHTLEIQIILVHLNSSSVGGFIIENIFKSYVEFTIV